MGQLSTYAAQSLMKHVFSSTAYSPPATVYLALCTTLPTVGQTGATISEVTNSNAYARVACPFGSASARAIAQNALISFPKATGAWGTIVAWALVDSATWGAGNMLAFGAISPSISPVLNNTPKIASGQVTISVNASTGSAGISTYLANKLLGLMFANTSYTQPAIYAALLNTAASDAAIGTEESGTGYARIQINTNGVTSPYFSAPTAASPSVTNNVQTVTITSNCGSGWAQFVGMALCDASTSGNMLAYDCNSSDVPTQTPNSGDTIEFLATTLVAQLQ